MSRQDARLSTLERACSRLGLGCALALAAFAGNTGFGQTANIASAPAGIVENGAPLFSMSTPESMGLRSSPTDLQRMPDGRLVAVYQEQIAIGDGMRWEVFQQAPNEFKGGIESLVVDRDGSMYAAQGNRVGRIQFDDKGQWTLSSLVSLDTQNGPQHAGLAIASQAGGEWFWHGVSGTVALWRPGLELRQLGNTNMVGRIFAFGGDIYFSDAANGELHRLEGDALLKLEGLGAPNPNNTVTGCAPLDAGHAFVGTYGRGLMIFDGKQLTETKAPAPLSGGHRINDLCAVEGGYYAAAVDNIGIVFFDKNGRIIQTVERANDHRFARAQKLLPIAGAQVWVLLSDGIARIEFPSRLSHFEPLIDTGLSYALPLRFQGRLWLCGDGMAQRGLYTEQGRLLRFIPDTPLNSYLYTLFAPEGLNMMLGGAADGLYAYQDGTWKRVLPELKKARGFAVKGEKSRWFYCAENEIGWLSLGETGLHAERCPVAGLADVYGGVVEDSGIAWLELGAGACGRVDLTRKTLSLESFGSADGLGNSWVQLFLNHGKLRLIIAGRMMRFNPTEHRFEDDPDMRRLYPEITNITGRAAHDSQGNFWMVGSGNLMMFDESGGIPRRLDAPNMQGKLPYYITTEDKGPVWMHSNHHLQRYDPSMPVIQQPRLRALISRVLLMSDNRCLEAANGRLPNLENSENSISFHFAAPEAPFGQALSFEVLLDGESKTWSPVGSTGVITYNKLKEGDYVLHVRPVAGNRAGEEASLSFKVLPPWFRTTTAYISYALAGLGFIGLAAWASTYLQRRDKARLENLVAQRTAQLNDSNRMLVEQMQKTLLKAQELQASEERFRHLNEDLEKRVAVRTAELGEANERLKNSNRELESFSYSVSHDLQAPLRNISGFAELLRKKSGDRLEAEGQRYLDTVIAEAVRLGSLIRSLLDYSRINRSEPKLQATNLSTLLEEVRREFSNDCEGRYIEWSIAPLPTMNVDPTLFRQVFSNLLGNAIKFTKSRKPARISIGLVTPSELPGFVVFFVRDNGAGFDAKYSDKLFGVFQRLHHSREFEGTGIGLANVRQIINRHGGRVWAQGAVDEGATFYFTLPETSAGG